MADHWLTSEQATRRLGVKPQTLYAYVSRGLIRSERVPGQRRSRFSRTDVERQATRSRVGGRAGGLEVIVETELTLLEVDGHLYYRGWDVTEAAASSSFEVVATWLWLGERDAVPMTASPAAVEAAITGVEHLRHLPPVDQCRAAVTSLRGADPYRADRRPSAVAATGRSMVGSLIETLPLVGDPAREGASVASRLWPRLTAAPPSESRVRLLDSVLILLADHELAASTLTARIAASTWADPYLVLLAGLSVLGGPLHGGASEGARGFLREAAAIGAPEAVGRRLGLNERLPGFGHRIYDNCDPRADVLLEQLAGHEQHEAALALVQVVADRSLPFPNIDFAIAVLAEVFDFIDGAGEVIFALARTAGWLAHAIEEYDYALRYRTRAAYIGPPPQR